MTRNDRGHRPLPLFIALVRSGRRCEVECQQSPLHNLDGVPSISTLTPSSSDVSGSRVSIWKVSIEAGMKWSVRAPIRDASVSGLPWR